MISALAVNFGREPVSVSTTLAATIAGYHDRKSDKNLTHGPVLKPASGGEITPITI
jgi:hypothetical protein